MKLFASLFLATIGLFTISACNNGTQSSSTSDTTQVKTDSVSPGSTAGFKLGVQMWTFRMFPFTEALNKVDSAGIKNIEAFWGQDLGPGMKGKFGADMSAADREKLKQLLNVKGIHIVAMGVIVPKNKAEWIKAFDLAKEFGLSYITAEPIKTQWDLVDSLAGAYGIPVAIHDHPKPNVYWSPDSVLAAVQGHPHIGSCADIGHWARNGLNPVDCLKKLEGHIIGVHLKDIVKFNETDAGDTVVSKGVIDIPAVLAELKRQNFSGMLSIEHESNWYHSLPDVIFTKNYYDAQIEKLNQK
ncbi:MAG TPA: sugar phosphate isomerase/epimerase family protein [Puia sp.]|jgi:sugar phosphate isomerase/epimerase|nr:sugar phosphate isomerase/epimerase family protein [Puia sp.]